MDDSMKYLFEQILEKTKRLSFPMFSNENKKSEILINTREKIDEEILQVLLENEKMRKDFEENRSSIWLKSESISKEKFEKLPSHLKVNSFYLQEVMTEYVQNVIAWINSSGLL